MNDIESAKSDAKVKASTALPEVVEVCTGQDPAASVIWLHGLGADGHDFEPAVPHMLWENAPAIRFIFPHAEVRPVTVNGGMRMRAWYDILDFNIERDHDAAGIENSVQQVNELIRREQRRGVSADKIVVAGFSQGGAIAIQVALRYPQRLAGLIALSTYLLNADKIGSQLSSVNRDLELFIGHGSKDPVVPFQWGEAAAKKCRELGCQVEWHQYPMEHSICVEELQHLSQWLSKRLGSSNG
jgi:phospholipase/carboxylesterase